MSDSTESRKESLVKFKLTSNESKVRLLAATLRTRRPRSQGIT
jgi:hypothetical protein